MKKKMLIFGFFLAIAMTTAFAENQRICANIAGQYDTVLEQGKEAYFSFRVYNSTTEQGAFCLPATFSMRVWMEGASIDNYFTYSLSTEKFSLLSGDNERILLTLTPKADLPSGSDVYTIFITASRQPDATDGSIAIFYEATGRIKATIGSTADTEYSDIPFWTVRKDCPNGVVVEQGQDCPAPTTKPKAIPATGLSTTLEGMDKGVIFTIVGVIVGGCIGLFAVYRHFSRTPHEQRLY